MSSEESVIDIKRALALWGDTVMRLALCKTHNRADAEDITQTVFLKLCQKTTGFDSNEHLKAWLLRVTLTSAADMARDPFSRHRVKLDDADEAVERHTRLHGGAATRDPESELTESFVADAVASLPEKQRLAVHLYYFEDYSTREIAAIMGEKPSTVRSHLHRARAMLKTLIGEYHD